MRNFQFQNVIIGDGFPVWIIAEIGGNFSDFQTGRKLIDLAVSAGADAVKLQTYQAETIATKKAVYDMPNVGKANQYELFKKGELSFELHKQIWDYCREKGITVFSTPSHMKDVELLERLGCGIYKIGSDDAVNIPFLTEVAALGKPMILSTGMCTMSEVRESVEAILGKGNSNLALLHCVTNYPSLPEHANLRCIENMKREFGLPVGYSDHTVGIEVSAASAALGANIIEKHFTYDKNADGPDHQLSADFDELKELIRSVRIIEKALGDGVKAPSAGETITRRNNRKSVVSNVNIPKGTLITKDMIAIKRPGYGIEPKHFFDVVGRTAKKDISAEEPILWEQI